MSKKYLKQQRKFSVSLKQRIVSLISTFTLIIIKLVAAWVVFVVFEIADKSVDDWSIN